MASKIFCLETEWDKTIHDMKKIDHGAKPILELLNNTNGVEYVWRQVASINSFEYYCKHLEYPSYEGFGIVYFCFHGLDASVHFADKSKITLNELGENLRGILNGRNIIFDSCWTLNTTESEILKFKKITGARVVAGYTTEVDLVDSFLFEAWLLKTMIDHPNYAAKLIVNKAQKEMPVHYKQLKFVAY